MTPSPQRPPQLADGAKQVNPHGRLAERGDRRRLARRVSGVRAEDEDRPLLCRKSLHQGGDLPPALAGQKRLLGVGGGRRHPPGPVHPPRPRLAPPPHPPLPRAAGPLRRERSFGLPGPCRSRASSLILTCITIRRPHRLPSYVTTGDATPQTDGRLGSWVRFGFRAVERARGTEAR